MTQAAFRYTFPITKAEKREDGYFITGFASGPEIDSEGERMDPMAIARFSTQINSAPEDDRLVYRDAHAPDGVMRDLGDITKAWVTEKFHLGIEVKLDEDNPASMLLFKKLKKGKQYGMSVAGHVVDYAMEYVESVGKSVLTYKNVVLDEISNTTRPAWYPSFGTVLSKSIKDASIDAPTTGVTVDENELLDETVEDATKSADDAQDETTVEVVETEKSAEDAYDASSAAYVAQSIIGLMAGDPGDAELRQAFDLISGFMSRKVDAISAEKSDDDTSDGEVEKAGRAISAATAGKLMGLYSEITNVLTEVGVLEGTETESEKSASETEEDNIEKTGDEDSTEPVITKSDLDALAAELKKANERIAELEARPATPVPGVITDATKKAAEDELAETFAKASPSEKMRLAFAARTGGR